MHIPKNRLLRFIHTFSYVEMGLSSQVKSHKGEATGFLRIIMSNGDCKLQGFNIIQHFTTKKSNHFYFIFFTFAAEKGNF